jgi:biopolymer transport protein ExbD
MAGASIGENEENPVAINVVAMVDVIFCLCVFFMCSFRFKQLEGKFDSWLPKDKGDKGVGADSSIIEEIRVAMFWDEAADQTVRQYKSKRISDDTELQLLIKEAHSDYVRLNKPDIPVIIDAEARVPWRDVVTVVNLCRRNNIEKIEFAFGAPSPKK